MYSGLRVQRLRTDAPSQPFCRMVAIISAAAALTACAGPATVVNKSDRRAVSGQTAVDNRHAPAVATRMAKHSPSASEKSTVKASYAVASFYSEDTETASGEKFDPHQMTAAHPTLPFGTRLRVTNVETGRSVTVRINDRGPFIPGRAVDLSHSAAKTIGMIDRGVTKVKLEVIK